MYRQYPGRFYPAFMMVFLLLVFLGFGASSTTVYADFLRYTQAGPYIVLIESEKIAMESENLKIHMNSTWSHIRADFVMRNDSSRQIIQVGFPQVVMFNKMSTRPGYRMQGIWDVTLRARPAGEPIGIPLCLRHCHIHSPSSGRGKPVIPEHIGEGHLADDGPEKIGALHYAGGYQESAVTPSINGQNRIPDSIARMSTDRWLCRGA